MSIKDKLGRQTGFLELTEHLIRAAVPICDHTARVGGTFSWEWPQGNLLWKDERVQALIARRGAERVCCVCGLLAGRRRSRPARATRSSTEFLSRPLQGARVHSGESLLVLQ